MRKNSVYEKTVFTSLGAVGLILLILLLRPFLGPEEHISGRISIEATPNEVWPYLVEGDKRAMWQKGVTSALPLTLDDMGAGSRAIVVYRVGGIVWDEEEEILEFNPHQTLIRANISESYLGETQNIITSSEGGETSPVTLEIKVTKTHLAYKDKFYGLFMAYKEQDDLEISLNALKSLIESGVN